jgi:tetratricopeptide (TPR) repeat protein
MHPNHVTQVVLLDPKDSVALQRVAEISAKAGRLRDALKAYSKMLRRDGSDISLLVQKANLSCAIGAFKRATSTYHQALELDPQSVGIALELAIVDYRADRLEHTWAQLMPLVNPVLASQPSEFISSSSSSSEGNDLANTELSIHETTSANSAVEREQQQGSEDEGAASSSPSAAALLPVHQTKEDLELSTRLRAVRYLVQVLIILDRPLDAAAYVSRAQQFLITGMYFPKLHWLVGWLNVPH